MGISIETGRKIEPEVTAVSRREAPGSAPASGAFLQRDRLRPAADYVAPSGPLEARVAAIWQEVLRIDRVGTRDDFFALGGDSMQALALFRRIEEAFGLALAPSTILERPTVAQLATLFSGRAASNLDDIVVALQPEGEDPPLFFFHALGGDVICYRNVVQHLGHCRRMFGIVYPHQDRTPAPAPSIPDLAARYVESIKRIQPAGPYFLIGFSLGGCFAFEAARQLRAQGERIALVVLIDSLTRQPMTKGLQRLVRKLAFHLGLLSDEPVSRWPGYLWRQVRNEFGRRKETRKAILDTTAEAELLPNPRQHVISALLAAHESYDPPVYDGSIKLFRCTQGGGVRWALTHLGWGGRARGGIEICELAVDHYMPMAEPAATHVAMQLKRWIDQATG